MTKNTKKLSRMRGENWKDLWHQAMPGKRSPKGITKACAMSEIASEKTPKTVHGCIVESHESTRQRVETSQPKNHEGQIAGKGFTSMSHKNLVHKFIPMPHVMKTHDAKAAMDMEWKKLRDKKKTAARVQCKREASRTRRAVASDRSANDIAKQVTMNRKREKVIRTRRKVACKSDREVRRQRDTRIDDTPAVPNEPTDHAVARGREVSLRYEGGHSPEKHTVESEWCWKPPTDRSDNDLSDQSLTVSRTRGCKPHDQGARARTASQRSRRAQC